MEELSSELHISSSLSTSHLVNHPNSSFICVFVYLCICVFVYLCICVFVFGCSIFQAHYQPHTLSTNQTKPNQTKPYFKLIISLHPNSIATHLTTNVCFSSNLSFLWYYNTARMVKKMVEFGDESNKD